MRAGRPRSQEAALRLRAGRPRSQEGHRLFTGRRPISVKRPCGRWIVSSPGSSGGLPPNRWWSCRRFSVDARSPEARRPRCAPGPGRRRIRRNARCGRPRNAWGWNRRTRIPRNDRTIAFERARSAFPTLRRYPVTDEARSCCVPAAGPGSPRSMSRAASCKAASQALSGGT